VETNVEAVEICKVEFSLVIGGCYRKTSVLRKVWGFTPEECWQNQKKIIHFPKAKVSPVTLVYWCMAFILIAVFPKGDFEKNEG